MVASPGIAQPRTGCCRLPLGTSFHSSHKLSISIPICTGTSSCEVGTPAFLTHSTPIKTQVHSIVAIPGIARLGLDVIGYLWLVAFILAIIRQYLYRFVLTPQVAK